MSYILVTGSNGFIAGFLINQLLKQNFKVLGISKNGNSNFEHENYKHIKADITDRLKLKQIFNNYEISTVIHLAAIAHIKGRKYIDWNDFYRVNTLASKTIFELAIKSNIDIFFASTVDVYGNLNAEIITEECKPKPITQYAISKLLAEEVLKKMAKKSSSKYIIARLAPVYGEDFMKDVYKRVYLNYPKIAYKIGNGYDYHFVSVYNIVDFVIEWLNLTEKPSGIFNVCDKNLANSNLILDYEKKYYNSRVFIVPEKIIPIVKLLLRILSKIVRIQLLDRINLNLYKLIHPPIYSIEKMKTIYTPKWDLRNTVYKNVN